MNAIVQALVVCTTIQIIAMFGMGALIYDRSTEHAKYFAAELVLQHRNEVQQQFSTERESLKQYVDRAIERAASQQTK